MKKINLQPVVRLIWDNEKGLKEFEENLLSTEDEKVQYVILKYPIVYIHNWKCRKYYEVYIGESNNIVKRTKQHYKDAINNIYWQNQLLKHKACLYVIGHEHFNKSLTLDIENRLMHYMMGSDKVRRLHNKRTNPQNKYYTSDEFDDIFEMIWMKLHEQNPELFPVECEVKDSAVFKASPLHELTSDQEKAKEKIIEKVMKALNGSETGSLIFIEGEAGTGKTVLNSSTFYDLYLKVEELGIEDLKCYLMVNHNEQLRVYEQIAKKLGLTDKYGKVVCKPTTFINNHKPEEPVDVAFIDEAHLLLTQGKQSYKGKNQLQDIIDRAKVTVVMFDENQILTTEQFWEAQVLDYFKSIAKNTGNFIELKDQLRMSADKETIDWIDAFTKYRELRKIPKDSTGYEIKVFDQPIDMEKEIKRKLSRESVDLSRIVATYDWEYQKKHSPKDRFKFWEVKIDEWCKPWNYELEKELDQKEKNVIKTLSWAEQPHTIDEVGSTFTIQGFDLNYVGVILGPSVKYRNGEVVFDPKFSCNDKAVRNRTLSDGTKKKFGETLIQHEVRVLMTRGIKGLYIYACDKELRDALKEAAK